MGNLVDTQGVFHMSLIINVLLVCFTGKTSFLSPIFAPYDNCR